MLKLYRNVVMVGLVGLGLAACGDKVTVTQPVTPVPGVTSVSVAPANLTIAINQQVAYAASVIADVGVATTVTWSTGNSAIATVDASGIVKGIAAGTTTIVATSTADAGKKGIASVTVSAVPPSIISFTITPTTATLAPGNFVQISPAFVMNPGVAAPTPTYSTSNAAVATVDASGKVIAVAAGTAVITATAVSGTSTLTATLGVTVRALIPATISISSVTTGILTLPVVLTNVAGQIEFNLNFNPGEQVIDSIAVFIGAKRAAKQSYITNPAAGIITLSVNTANFVKNPTLGTATVDYLNGNSTISAAIYPRNVATATATQTTPIVLNNLDGWAADITKPTVNANSAGGITFWGGPTAPASAILYPVIYTPGRGISTVTWTLGAAGFGTCSNVTQTALPFTQTFGGTAGQSACAYENTTAIRDNMLVIAALDNSNNTYPLVNAVTPLIPNTIVLGATPDSLRIDYMAPSVNTPSIARTAPAVMGWVNAGFNFVNFASADAGVGLRAARDRKVYYDIDNCPAAGAQNNAMATGTGADIPECATNFIGGAPGLGGSAPYDVYGTESDRLGNLGTSSVTATFGVDKTAPQIRFGTADASVGYLASLAADTIFRASKPARTWRAEYLDDRSGFYNNGQPDGTPISAQYQAVSRARHIQPTGACIAPAAGVIGASFVTAPACTLAPITVGGSLRADGWQGGMQVAVPADEAYYGYTTMVSDAAGNASATLFRKALVNTMSPFATGLGVPGTVTAAGFNIAPTFADSAEIAAYSLQVEYPNFAGLAGGAVDSVRYPRTSIQAAAFDNVITSPFTGTINPSTPAPYVRSVEAVTGAAFPGLNVAAAPTATKPVSVVAWAWNTGSLSLPPAGPAAGRSLTIGLFPLGVQDGVTYNTFNTGNVTNSLTHFRIVPSIAATDFFGSSTPLRAQAVSPTNTPNAPFVRVDFYRYEVAGGTQDHWNYLGSSTTVIGTDQGTYRSWVYPMPYTTFGAVSPFPATGWSAVTWNGTASGVLASGQMIVAVGVTAAGDGIAAGWAIP